jgi:tetratricopeptide (TPR) repeat protein
MLSARTTTIWSLLFGLAAEPWQAWAGPEEYLLPLPAPWTVQLDLPPRSDAGPTGVVAVVGERSVRQWRDEALAAYDLQDYGAALDALDRMAAIAPLSPTLRLLQAWCASFSGRDERAATLWTQLAAQSTNEPQYAYMSGWHCMQLGRYRDAYAYFLRHRSLQPGRDASHLAGISAWGARRLAAAERLLVEAIRQPMPWPESFAAMAALQAEQKADMLAIGWLRKALPSLSETRRAELLFRPSFELLWQRSDAGWSNLLAEFGLPADRARLAELALTGEAMPAPPPLRASTATPDKAFLNMSPFSQDPAQRALQLDAVQRERRLRRLALDEVEPDPTPANPDEKPAGSE